MNKAIFSKNSSFIKFTTLVLFLLGFTSLEAQDLSTSYSICYEESISKNIIRPKFLANVSWVINDLDNQILLEQGEGVSLYDFVFIKPGNYQLDFIVLPHEENPDECNHSKLPSSISLQVNSNCIEYAQDDCVLSQDLIGGSDISGTVLSVPVVVRSFYNESVEIPSFVNSAGIDAKVTGTLQESQKFLSPGSHIINFNLSGTFLSGTYISFDFKDLNGEVFSYYHLPVIK
ncbi:MAG: hypothetical protein KDC82_03525 [Bacteroidetes bacterium]|nr:hypothetical protein [Bacteroidota bacterium]